MAARDFSLSPICPNWFWGPMQSSISCIWVFFPSGGVGVGSKAADASSSLPPSSAEVKNKWCCISTLPVNRHTLNRDNCTTIYVRLNFFKWILSKHLVLYLTKTDWLWSQPSCLFNDESMRLTKCYHLVLKLRRYGITPCFSPHFPSDVHRDICTFTISI